MARPGVTYMEVAEAANHLLGQNKNPTIEQIRLLLGTGSSTTIANHLKQWKQEQQAPTLLAAKENIPPELMTLVKGLWERVVNHSEMEISAAEADIEDDMVRLGEELHKYKTNNRRWQRLFHQWQQERTRLMNDRLVLEEVVMSLQKEKAALLAKQEAYILLVREKQERIDELQNLHAKTQHSYSQYQAFHQSLKALELIK